MELQLAKVKNLCSYTLGTEYCHCFENLDAFLTTHLHSFPPTSVVTSYRLPHSSSPPPLSLSSSFFSSTRTQNIRLTQNSEFLPFFLPCHLFLDDFIQSYDFKCHLYVDPFQIRILQSKSLLSTRFIYLTISQHLYLNMYVMGFLPLLKQNYGLSTLALL